VKVLVVDDSAFARKVLRETLAVDPAIEVVGTARDGIDALEKIADLKPDVVALDLVMPNLDGLGVLRALQHAAWQPTVVVVSMADEDSELGLEALSLGVFEVVKKPTALATEQLYEVGEELRATVKAAVSRPRGLVPAPRPVRPSAGFPIPATRTRMVLIGASTGGPHALGRLLRELPRTFPVPIAIVLHMPAGYTEAFARRLDADSDLDIGEARDGMVLRPGTVAVARAGMHLLVEGEGDHWTTRLDASPLDAPHRPSVDVLFASGARLLGSGVLAVVLTGMGSDGLEGSRAIVRAGGRVLTEAESSCVVYGMPRSVHEAGLSCAEAPIERMASLICTQL
jgi:two-component system chemotaxis response regulator CheB